MEKKKVLIKKLKKQYIVALGIILLSFLYLVGFKLSKGTINSLDHYQYQTNEKDYVLNYTPMKHAKRYQVIIKKDKKIIFKQETTKTTLSFPLSQVEKGDKIEIIVKGINALGLKKSVSLKKIIEEPVKKVSEVFSSHQEGKINGFKQIILTTKTKGAKIYYTTDGSKPDENSTLYEEPIYLSKSMTIQSIALLDEYEPSKISSFSYQVIDKRPIVYLSPSTQDENYGVEEVGYTTEKEMMNKIADVVYQKLIDHNIVVYRNKKVKSHKEAAIDSRKYDVDLHLALHSNASDLKEKGKYSGIETWIYDDTCFIAKEIASQLQKNLFGIYYKKQGNRGVKNSADIGGLLETNPKNVNNGILIEIAFHDHVQDAKWIVDNIEKIGNTIADTIILYYQERSK